MRKSASIRISASIVTLLFVLGMVFPHVLSARSNGHLHKVEHAGKHDHKGGKGHGKGLPFDDKDSDPERDLPCGDERELEKEAEWLSIFIARSHEACLSRILTEHLRSHADEMLGANLGIPRYIVLQTFLL
jgi:hypothetical protein